MGHAGSWFRRRTWAVVFAAGASIAVGCAQIAGIEPWKQADPCDQPDVDPDTCLPKGACADCLFAQHVNCEPARTDCESDPASVCSAISSCAQACKDDIDPVACSGTCCATNNGDSKYDVYLTCVCGACTVECGKKVTGCDALCDLPPP